MRGSCAVWCGTFSRNPTFSEAVACPGQLRCLGQNFAQKSDFLFKYHLTGAAALPGAELFQEIYVFFEEVTCLGQLRCLGQIVSRTYTFF